jgi:hypothetical protein
MKLSSLLWFSLCVSLVVSCADKKPVATAVPKDAQVSEQKAATELPTVPNNNLDLANQLRDPSGMIELEAANGTRGASAPVRGVNVSQPVEIPRPTNAVPTPPLSNVNMPEIPDKE